MNAPVERVCRTCIRWRGSVPYGGWCYSQKARKFHDDTCSRHDPAFDAIKEAERRAQWKEYDSGSCVTALGLREIGLVFPDTIPDEAWVPARSIQLTVRSNSLLHYEREGKFEVTYHIICTEPFRWVEGTCVICKESDCVHLSPEQAEEVCSLHPRPTFEEPPMMVAEPADRIVPPKSGTAAVSEASRASVRTLERLTEALEKNLKSEEAERALFEKAYYRVKNALREAHTMLSRVRPLGDDPQEGEASWVDSAHVLALLKAALEVDDGTP